MLLISEYDQLRTTCKESILHGLPYFKRHILTANIIERQADLVGHIYQFMCLYNCVLHFYYVGLYFIIFLIRILFPNGFMYGNIIPICFFNLK
jgi:hypothetical protein